MAKLFKDEDFENYSLQELADKIDPKAREMFDEFMDECAMHMLCAIASCESPIEQMMALALQDLELRCLDLSDKGCFNIEAQRELELSGKKFRVDFCINALYKGDGFNVVVECDGHDFHEKTKQQATRDKQRDRILTKHGYIVLRLTGSEIWDDPHKCAREALSVIFGKRL